jgi:hypothetical protein
VQVVPRRSARRFGEDGATGARVLHDVLGRLRAVLRHVAPVNAWVRAVPSGAERWCWHIELMPDWRSSPGSMWAPAYTRTCRRRSGRRSSYASA